MQAEYRLKKNRQYNYVYKHAESAADKFFVVLYCKSNNKQSRIGFSVSKKYGNAVRRNRLRRQLKSAASKLMPDVVDYKNIVVIPRKTEDYEYSEIYASLVYLFGKAGLTI